MGDDPRREIEVLREKLQNEERDIDDDADREKLLEFSDELFLLKSEYGDYRHIKLLRHCTRMAENVGGLAEAIDDEDAAREIVRWIHQTYDNEDTNADYRKALRIFGKRLVRRDEPPESLAWIPSGKSNDYDPVPREAEMLRWDEDVEPMLEACQNSRDAAVIAVQFEGGFRGGELRHMRVGDVFDSEYSMGIHVDGKQGERAVHLIVSVPYLQRWLDDHPAPDDPDAPLWSKLQEPEEMSYNGFRKCIDGPAERAGVERDTTPTNFRKSNTRWLVLQGLSQARIEDRQGRARGSDHTAHYMARFGEDSNERRYAAVHGLDVEETEDESVEPPIECPRCGQETPATKDHCMWCHQALSPEAADRMESAVDDLVGTLVEADDAAIRASVAKVRDAIESDPESVAHDDGTSSS